MAWLLGLRDTATLETHAARGALFETWGVSETPRGLQAIEIKSGSTFAPDWPQAARKWASFADAEALAPMIVYGGMGRHARQECGVAGWQEFALGMTL